MTDHGLKRLIKLKRRGTEGPFEIDRAAPKENTLWGDPMYVIFGHGCGVGIKVDTVNSKQDADFICAADEFAREHAPKLLAELARLRNITIFQARQIEALQTFVRSRSTHVRRTPKPHGKETTLHCRLCRNEVFGFADIGHERTCPLYRPSWMPSLDRTMDFLRWLRAPSGLF